MPIGERATAKVAFAGIFCTALALAACTVPSPGERTVSQPVAPVAPPVAAPALPVVPPALDPQVVVPERDGVVTLQPVSEPRYAPPESLKQFRFPQKNQPGIVLAKPSGKRPPVKAPAPAASDETPVEVAAAPVATVDAGGESPRYKLPDSLSQWRPGRKVPLYEDPEAAPWQASPTEARLKNAAVSCNYKDEGGVRGKVTLLVDDFKVTRFNARIEMPNGGTCQFDSKKMEQRPFEQGIALQSTGDECVVRMWEQKHRITIAAYSCHKQCSKGSFSYLWPILMDTRIGTCY